MGSLCSKTDTVPSVPTPEMTHPLNRHPYHLKRPRHHRPDLALQGVRVRVRNPKVLHYRNAVTMMVGTTRARHSGVMYSPRNIQITRKCGHANIRPVVRVVWSGLDPCRWV